ncbi:glycosyltransferase family 4 protein [Methylocystis sp. JAN1]|uniref:glycosyltransferase family 4 protein n=1 Tax=Methylocystis sp. JAN1 TaxID=3397211 RepID=UPI003FA24C77
MSNRILLIGGTDHNLRMSFFLGLKERGFEPVLASSGNPQPFAEAGLEHHSFDFHRFVDPLKDWRAVQSLRALLKKVQPDIVESFDTKLNLLVAFANMGEPRFPLIRTINGLGWLYASNSVAARILRPVYRGLHRFASSAVSRTLFENQEDKAYFEQTGLADPKTTRWVPGAGVDVEGFMNSFRNGPASEETRRQLGLEGREILVTVTRLTREKGILTLLKAAEIVHRSRPNVCFLLVGPRESEGPMAIPAEEIENRADFVVATGWRDDVPSLLKASDLCVFPTEYREGVPRAVMEAAIAELPIVTTDVPGCRDVVRDGSSGYLATPGDYQGLARKIMLALDEPRKAKAMALRASALVKEKYALDVALDSYVAVYRELLEDIEIGAQ